MMTPPSRSRSHRPIRPGRGRGLALLLASGLLWASPASAGVRLEGDEALALAFPGCEIERRTVFLSKVQKEAAEKLAGAKIESALVHPYLATCEGKPGGAAYFDVHRVRTLPERVMVAVDAGGKILRIEVLSFDEPPDYLPRRGWYGQFEAKRLEDDLSLEGAIRPVAGATLTAEATSKAARRVLALHRVIFGAKAEVPPEPAP
ncbi:MAG: FMN-binding protein [Deltaproteobacteria bacterium]|nr:FMN-binding protein [Deltaproteobacteria bacterium]